MITNQNYFKKSPHVQFELDIHKRLKKKILVPLPKIPKTADMEKKGDIPMAQIYDVVVVLIQIDSNLSLK
jgi:hypothetical protein